MPLKMYSFIQAGCIVLAILFFIIGCIVFGVSGEGVKATSKSASSSASSSVSSSSKTSAQEIADAVKDIASTYIDSTKEAMELLQGNN